MSNLNLYSICFNLSVVVVVVILVLTNIGHDSFRLLLKAFFHFRTLINEHTRQRFMKYDMQKKDIKKFMGSGEEVSDCCFKHSLYRCCTFLTKLLRVWNGIHE